MDVVPVARALNTTATRTAAVAKGKKRGCRAGVLHVRIGYVSLV
jgi:hypothetical protein